MSNLLGKHNQIPELLAHFEQDGRQYLVQEFIDGENLLQELNRGGGGLVRQRLRIYCWICCLCCSLFTLVR